MSIFGNNKSSESIAAESRRLAQSKLAWSNRLLTKRGEIAKFEASLAELSSEPADQVEPALGRASSALAALHSECTAIERTIEASRQKRRDVLQELRTTRAAELRRDAQANRRMADELTAKGDKALAAFAEVEEVALEKVVGVCRGSLALRSDALRRRAGELDSQAQDLERAGAPDGGLVDIDDITSDDQIIAAVLEQDVVGPAVDEIRNWLAVVQRAAKKDFGDRTRRVRMLWKHGRIDTES